MSKSGAAQKISNAILSGLAGVASFIFSLAAFLYLTEFDEQVLASIIAGAFCLLISYIASERPNSESARAMSALGDRLLAVEDGDFTTPAPDIVQRAMPDVAKAVDHLFAEVRASIENAQALGMYDPVTSLPNRLHFRAEADRSLGMVANDQPAAMLFVDLDRFKAVNDGLGHARGDQLLTMVANRLRVVVTAEMDGESGARPLLARLAGDEFTIFFPKIRDRDHISRIARRIALAISEPFELHGHSIDIGASIGVAVVPEDGTTIEKLMRAADIAMYRAKALGGSQHIMFTESLLAEHEAKLATEHALTAALERDEFLIEMQPQVDLVTGEMTGAEALLRWTHPVDGPRPPESFIKVAEKSGLIADIGDWVIDECAATLEAWVEKGNARRLAFNISPRQLDRPDFFERMRASFAAHNVPLSLVELEFTETTAMQANEQQTQEIAALRDDGAMVTIDDFGTGYSNIARLRTMPLDRVKLDPSLIDDIHVSETAREVVQAVVTLVHSVGAEVVAEAVEVQEQVDILRAMGCRTVQGFMYARPMKRDEFFDWAAARDLMAKKGAGRSVA